MVFLFQRFIAHYRLPIYKRIGQILDGQLVLVYGQPPAGGFFLKSSETNDDFKALEVRNVWFKGEQFVWQKFWKPFSLFSRPQAVVAEGSPRIISLFPLYWYCRLKNIPFILWGHGGSRKRSVSGSLNVKDFIHRWLVRSADAYICYTDGIRDELSRITQEKKLFVARNTLDTDTLLKIHGALQKEGRIGVKKRLGLANQYYICFIGRLLADKQVDYLIDVYEQVRRRSVDCGLLIIGDGPEERSLRNYAQTKKVEDIRFLGGISDWQESGQYLYAADVMVMPGYVGLSINHAYCFGLPVITQESGEKGPFHSPEIEYITEGETGFICRNGNKEEMAERIIDVLKNHVIMRENVRRFCEEKLTLDTMVSGIEDAVNFAARKDNERQQKIYL